MYPCHLSNSAPAKKNPFLGQELLWFANPNKPQGPEGSEMGDGKELSPLAKEFLEVIPGRLGEPEELMQRKDWWVSELRNYSHIQHDIDYFYSLRAELNDPKLINTPDYKEVIKRKATKAYQEMARVLGTLPNAENSLTDSINKNLQNELKADRVDTIRKIDKTIAELMKQRKLELQTVGEHIKIDLMDRAIKLHDLWVQNPPKGYEDEAPDWAEYLQETWDALEKQDLSALDDGKKDSPLGNALLQGAQEWWDCLGAMEDTYMDFTRNDPSQFTVENAEAQYKAMKAKTESILSDKAVQEFIVKADEVIKKGGETLAAIDAKMAEWKNDKTRKGDYDTLLASKIQLTAKLKDLADKKNIKDYVLQAFSSDKEIAKFKVPGGEVSIPEGLEGQIEALKKVPMHSEGRRKAIRMLMEAINEIGKNVENYSDFADVKLPQALVDMQLFVDGMDVNTNKRTREFIWVNPFATLGHVWHSYTEAVKSNVETDEKRGAGYFQKGFTEKMSGLGRVPVIGKIKVIKSLTELSINGSIEAEHAEHHRIGEFEKQYENVPPDHLAHIASEASDQWELQGCLKVMAKQGRINWYAPWLFKALKKYQKTIDIPEDHHWHMRNISESNELLRQAFVYIYRDEDVYKSLRNTNLSSYESKMGEYSKQWGPIAAQEGALRKRAESILAVYQEDHKNGVHNSTASPIEFESIIRYAMDQGKMKMEERLKLLVQGIACGLLSFDRGINATDKNNGYPPYDYFETDTLRGGKPTYDDVLEWAVYAKSPETWDYFMHKADGVMNNTAVNERLMKTMTQGSHRLDHDDAAGIAGYLTVNITRDLLKQKTQGGYGMPVTGLKSLSTGNEFWLRMYAEEYDRRTPKQNRDEMIRFASQFMMYDGILNDRVFKGSQDYFRLTDATGANETPRFSRGGYSKVFGTKDSGTVREIVSDTADMLALLDYEEIPLIRKLIHNEIRTDNDASSIAQKLEYQTGMFKGDVPKNIDELYAKMNCYFEFIMDKTENVEKLVSNVKAQHSIDRHHYEHAVHHDIEHIREAERVRGITGKEPEHH